MQFNSAHFSSFGRVVLVLLVGILSLTACSQAASTESQALTPLTPTAPSSPPSQPTQAPDVFTVSDELTLPPEPTLYRDQYGIGVLIDDESLSDEQQLILRTGEGGAAALGEIEAYRVPGLPLYQLDLHGEGEGSGHIELVVPAEHPETRIVEIIDGEALIVYEVEPVDGEIRLPLQVADSTGSDVDIMFAPGTRVFAVVGSGPAVTSKSRFNPFAATNAYAQNRDHRQCRVGSPPIPLPNCWTTWNGTASVSWGRSGLLSPSEAQAILTVATELQAALLEQGFTNARPSAFNPLKIVVDPGDGWISVNAPTYKSTLGVIKIPYDSALAIRDSNPRLELAHELMHWIQDARYNMLWGFIRRENRWWLEITAEIGAFLIDENGADANVRAYGQIQFDDKRLVFQAEPYAWQHSEQYLQAQLIYANMCASGCPLTEEQVISSVNQGIYPLRDHALRGQISERIEEYARYVLTGEHPNGSIVTTLQTGAAVGDFVQLARNQVNGSMRLIVNNHQQFDATTRSFSAALAADSVYPLIVGSGSNLQPVTSMPSPSGPPAMFVVEPGAPFLYQIDDGAIQRHDGQSELWLGPLHDPLAHYMIRLVAFAGATPEQFTARLEEIDLAGDWVLSFSNARVSNLVCTGDNDADNELNATEIIQLLGLISSHAATNGSYEQDSNQANVFSFTMPSGVEFCAEEGCERFSYASNLTLDSDGIRIIQHLAIAPPNASQSLEAPLFLLAIGLPLGMLLMVGNRRRRLLLPVIVLLILPQLTGCVELRVHGSIASETTFKHLELLRDNDPAQGPLVRLSAGEGVQTLDLTFVAETAEDRDAPQSTVCRGEIAVSATAELFPDGVVQLPGLFDFDDDDDD